MNYFEKCKERISNSDYEEKQKLTNEIYMDCQCGNLTDKQGKELLEILNQ